VGLPRALLVLLGLASAVVVVAGLKATASIVGPAFLALVLTVLVHPVRRWLTRRRVPSWLASVLCIAVVYLLLVGLTLSLLVAVARFAELLPSYRAKFADLVDDLTGTLRGLGVDQEQIEQISDAFDVSQLGGLVTELLSGALGLVSNLFFLFTLVLFMTVDAAAFPRYLALTAERRPSAVEALASFAQGTRTYLLVSTVFGLIVAVFDTVALSIMGVPVPVLWGLLAFITNYIPNVGFVIGLIPPAVLGLLEGGPGMMLSVIAVYSVINVVIQSIIQPKFVGDAVGLSTTLTFLSLVFWAWVIGPLGALLAIPLSLLAKAVLVDSDPDSRWLVPLLSNKDEGPPQLVTEAPTAEGQP
jgi:predicted PurR-regulated permease PerM